MPDPHVRMPEAGKQLKGRAYGHRRSDETQQNFSNWIKIERFNSKTIFNLRIVWVLGSLARLSRL